jgi:Urocanase N-terminal domain/Urocanase Rossmann-like domain
VDTAFRGAPRGLELRCQGWEQEGALRCLLNNLDPDVTEDAAALVVYGGQGRAARSSEALADIVAALERLGPEETLIVQSGKAVAVLPTHADAPRVLISTAMIVPAWSDEESFRSLEDAGLTMYGQMTAAGWFYIGTQGILGFTYETFRAVGAAHFGGTLAGKRVLTAGLGGMGGAQGFAVTRNGGRALVLEVDPLRADRRARDGWVDLVAGYDDALAAHLDPEGPGTVALVGNAADVVPRFLADGVDFDVVTDQTAAHDPLRGYVPRGFSAERAGEADPDDPAFRARSSTLSPPTSRRCWASGDEAQWSSSMETAWHAISSFSKRCPSFGGIVAAEPVAALERFRDRGRGLGRVRQLRPQVLGDGGVDVEPGEVHRLERPDCGPACAKPVGDGAVDVGERANTRVDERICLPQERVLEAVGDEARNVPPDHDGGLAELFHPPSERLEGLGSGALPADDLHELDQLGGLNQCRPAKSSGRARPPLSAARGRDDVFVVRIASGAASSSACARSSRFAPISSTIVSTTSSAPSRASSTEPWSGAPGARCLPAESVPS